MPPTHMIGADTISVKVIRTSICTCWTSLVVRVISEGAPNWPDLAGGEVLHPVEDRRRARRGPTAIAVRAPKYTARDRAHDLDQGDGRASRRRPA